MFYVCVGRKITTFQNTKIELDLGGAVFKVDPMKLNELETHIKHILETSKGKVKYLNESISEEKEEALDKSYETLVKFVTQEGVKLITEDENNLRKITFFKNLLEFMNADLCLPRVKIAPRKIDEEASEKLLEDIKTYTSGILTEAKIANLVNTQDSKTMQGSLTAREVDLEWVIEYDNRLKNENANEVWKMVGEALEAALGPRESQLKVQEGIKTGGK